MPLLDFDKQETWDHLYAVYLPAEDRIAHFERAARDSYVIPDAWYLRNALNVKKEERVVIIGGAFGWVAEDWYAAGIKRITVVDNSKWIHARKAVNSILPILDANILTASGRALVKNEGKPDFVISEDVLPTLSDQEATALSAAMRTLGGSVVHWVTPSHPANYAALNWKTGEEWKALLAPDRIVVRASEHKVI